MSLFDGFTLIEELKRHAATKHLPVAVLTTSSRDRDRERSLAAGACAYYEKPGTLGALEKILRDALARCALLSPA